MVSSSYGTSTFTSYLLVSRNLTRSLEQTQKDPVVARETAYYKANISSIKTVDDFIGNTRIFTYAMKAFGLEDMTYAKAYMRKVLDEGITDKKAFANRLNDDRFVNFAKTFDFFTKGEQTTASADVVQPVVDKFTRQTLENTQGESDMGVRLALYFQRAAPDVKSAYGILADTAMTQVVRTAFGLPDSMGTADIEIQKATIDRHLKIADLKDPEKLSKLIQRFTVMWDAANNVTSSPVLRLFDTTTNVDVSMSILNLKYGG